MNETPIQDVSCFLLDMDGTFYLGDHLIEGALEFVRVLEAQGKQYVFLTNNSSKHRGQYAQKIAALGLQVPEDRIFTSGEATVLYIRQNFPYERLYVAGTAALEQEFQQHGFILDRDHPQAFVLGFDMTLTYDKLWYICDLVRSGLPYIATHPDFNCPTETGFMPDIGAMIAFIKASANREPDTVIGKPNRQIVDMLAYKLGIPVERMAMIGDRLYTDIALRQTAGIPALLVLSGETRPEDLEDSVFQPTRVFQHLGDIAQYLAQAWSVQHSQP